MMAQGSVCYCQSHTCLTDYLNHDAPKKKSIKGMETCAKCISLSSEKQKPYAKIHCTPGVVNTA